MSSTAGSAAATSEATSPAWCGTARAARPWATAAAAAASSGVDALGEEGADDAGEHVAGARGRERRRSRVADDAPPVGRAHDRVGPLEQRRRAEALGAARRGLEPVRGDPRPSSTSSSRASSPACGVSTVGAARSPGSSAEERVGVHDSGQRRARSRSARTSARASSRAAEAGPERERRRALDIRGEGVRRGRPVEAALDGLERKRLGDRERRGGDGEGHVARVGAKRRGGGEDGGARRPGCPADDEQRAGA